MWARERKKEREEKRNATDRRLNYAEVKIESATTRSRGLMRRCRTGVLRGASISLPFSLPPCERGSEIAEIQLHSTVGRGTLCGTSNDHLTTFLILHWLPSEIVNAKTCDSGCGGSRTPLIPMHLGARYAIPKPATSLDILCSCVRFIGDTKLLEDDYELSDTYSRGQ